MTAEAFPLYAAAAAALPMLGVFLAAPRRTWLFALFCAASVAAWLTCGLGRWSQAPWWGLFAWIAAAAVWGVLWIARFRAQEDRWRDDVAAERRRLRDLDEEIARLKADTEHREKEQKNVLAVYGIIKGLSEALNWETLRSRMEAAIEKALGLDQFVLFVAGGTPGGPGAAGSSNPGGMVPLIKRKVISGFGSQWSTLEEFKQLHHADLSVPQVFEKPDRFLGVPIFHSGDLLGYLFARLSAGQDEQKALEESQNFAQHITFALKRVLLFQEVEALSETDGLTGVYRRQKFEERLDEETRRAETFKTSYCVLLLDVDHFKRCNDVYGHPFGDAVLRRMGGIFKECVYETDFVARYGGEEFAILLPRAQAEGVLRKAERIRQRVEAEAFQSGLETVRVTVSTGIAHYPRDGKTPKEVIAQADRALYAAKRQGRNRIVDASEI
ncbi:MAG: diguanylate cyclase [Elusimicrobia bacterium]|nr:diguanylate cyclase [Elusimicrobiota bacterium]